MKQEVVARINRIGKISHTLVTILKVFLYIGCIFALVGACILAILPKDFIKMEIAGLSMVDVDLGALNVELTDENRAEIMEQFKNGEMDVDFSINNVSYKANELYVVGNVISALSGQETVSLNTRDFAVACILATIIMAVSLVMVYFVDGLCKAFRDCESPFEENVVTKMQKFSYALIPWAVVSTSVSALLKTWFVADRAIFVGIDLNYVIAVLVLLILVQIFRYGAVLQQESDETL